MERQLVTSSSIVSIGYDATNQVLEVEFPSGHVYQYSDVPEQVYLDLIGGGSVGSCFNSYVRHAYAYVRL